MSMLINIPAHATAQSNPAPALVMRCGGNACPPGTCGHTDDPDDAVVHRSADGSAIKGGLVPQSVLRVLETPGTPLDSSVRASMESRLGHDFGRVQRSTVAPAQDEGVRAAAQGLVQLEFPLAVTLIGPQARFVLAP